VGGGGGLGAPRRAGPLRVAANCALHTAGAAQSALRSRAARRAPGSVGLLGRYPLRHRDEYLMDIDSSAKPLPADSEFSALAFPPTLRAPEVDRGSPAGKHRPREESPGSIEQEGR
jgi:hypothetical protein